MWLVSVYVLVAILFSTSCAADTPDLYVSVSGNDAWSGGTANPTADGTDGPLATLSEARERVAEMREKAPHRSHPIIVSVRGGTYFLDRTFILTSEDSGTPLSPTIYEAYRNERPVLSGGVPVTGWTVTNNGHWQTEIKEGSENWQLTQLFVNDQRRERTRLPHTGYFYIAEGYGRNQFTFGEDEIEENLKDLDDVEILVFHDWSASRLRLASVSLASKSVKLVGRAGQPLQTGSRYIIFNAAEELKYPGQWHLDKKTRVLKYIPLPGETPTAAAVIAPKLSQVLRLQGNLPKKQWVENIHFRGLTFAHSNWTLPPAGQSFPQAEIGLDAAVSAVGARSIVFESCIVRHTGGYAMAFGQGSQNNIVEKSELVDLGAGGVKIGHSGAASWSQVLEQPVELELKITHHILRDNIIAHGGRVHPSAVGVWIGQSSNNVIEHNDIYDHYQSAISVGWTWGYGLSGANNNIVSHNRIRKIGQGVMSDLGGIYTLGPQQHTRLYGNLVHGVSAYDYGGWGIYLDEGSSYIRIENNIVSDTTHGGFHQHYGSDNIIQNNIFVSGGETQIAETRVDRPVSFYLQHNIFYWRGKSPLFGRCHTWEPPCTFSVKSDYNLYWNDSGSEVLFPGGFTLSEWQAKRNLDVHSIVANPFLIDKGDGDYVISEKSPAISLGIQPIPLRSGRRIPRVLTQDLPKVRSSFEGAPSVSNRP